MLVSIVFATAVQFRVHAILSSYFAIAFVVLASVWCMRILLEYWGGFGHGDGDADSHSADSEQHRQHTASPFANLAGWRALVALACARQPTRSVDACEQLLHDQLLFEIAHRLQSA